MREISDIWSSKTKTRSKCGANFISCFLQCCHCLWTSHTFNKPAGIIGITWEDYSNYSLSSQSYSKMQKKKRKEKLIMNYGNKLELFFSVHPRLHRQLMFGELWVWSLWGGWTTSLQAVISCVVSLSALISGPLSATEISVVLAVNANLMCCMSTLLGVWYRLSTGGPEDIKAKNKAQCSAQTLFDFSCVLEPVNFYMKTHTHMVSSDS